MKKLNKLLFNGFFWLVCAFSLNAQQAQLSVRMSQTISNGVVTPEEMMVNPACLAKVWATEPLAADFYTELEVAAQRIINSKVAESVLTYSPIEIEKEWTSIDFEEITPYTWKWVDFELPKPDGTLTKIALRRPHWWLRDIGADSLGKQVYLNMPELGSQGWATVKAIRVNQLDTRFWDENRQGDFVSRPITGKFEHESNDVYYLYFGENSTPLGVTGSHPIWSIDRNDWVGAGDLQIGEKVKTQDGLTVLKSRYKSDEKQKVYNLEIYKDHNFLVSTDKILVHNTCFPIKSLQGKSLNWINRQKPKGWQAVSKDNGLGWKWLDENGNERLIYQRPSGENAANSQWSRMENGYFRWKDEKGNFLDIDGNIVDKKVVGEEMFNLKTHIPYEGVH